MKKFTAILLSLAIITGMVGVMPVSASDPVITLTVTPLTATAVANDVVTFKVNMSSAEGANLTAMEFKMDVPTGFEYVEGSATVTETAELQLGMDYTNNTIQFNGLRVLSTMYNGAGMEIGEFKLRATAAISSNVSVGLKDVKLLDGYNNTIANSVVPAVVNSGSQPPPGGPSITLTVTPSPSTAEANDVVTFKVNMSSAEGANLTAMEFKMDIPTGFEYVEGSATVTETAELQLGMDYTNDTIQFNGLRVLSTMYNGAGMEIGEFKLRATAEISSNVSVGLKDVKLLDGYNSEVAHNVVRAVVNSGSSSADELEEEAKDFLDTDEDIKIEEEDGKFYARGVRRGTRRPGTNEELRTGEEVPLPSGNTIIIVILYDVGGGSNNFANLMLMMFHIYGVEPLTNPAFIMAAGTRTPNNFADLMTAMFAIYGVN